MKYIPLLALHVQGVYVEILMHGMKWFNATVGVSEAVMVPVGYCSCSFKEVQEGTAPPVYLTAGSFLFFLAVKQSECILTKKKKKHQFRD